MDYNQEEIRTLFIRTPTHFILYVCESSFYFLENQVVVLVEKRDASRSQKIMMTVRF